MHVHSLNGSGPLAQCEERLRVTLDCTPVGIAHLDAQGGWQLINRQLCRLLGLDAEELLSTRFEALLELHLRQAPTSIERCYVRPDGALVWLRITSTRIPSGYVVILEDLSARRASEHALGFAAHELRLPLSHIKGFISTLRRRDVVLGDRMRREFLAEAEREVNRLEDLIRELLDEASDERAAAHRRTAISPRVLVVNSVSRVRSLIGDREVRIDVPPGMPQLRVEVASLERVLANLLLNANTFSPRNAPIEVTAQLVAEMLELRVDDRGPGVPPDEYEQVFEPFYHRAVKRYESEAGHGLGLAICRSIVTAHAGRIWVTTRPGGGARFTVALPVTPRTTRKPVPGIPVCAKPGRLPQAQNTRRAARPEHDLIRLALGPGQEVAPESVGA